jgi:hypothetical protein
MDGAFGIADFIGYLGNAQASWILTHNINKLKAFFNGVGFHLITNLFHIMEMHSINYGKLSCLSSFFYFSLAH